MATLILVRHGNSAWNKLGLWTGKTDVDLTAEGRDEARKAGELIRDITIGRAYVSSLCRTHQTLDALREGYGKAIPEPTKDHALDERDYGSYTGKNKWEVKEEIGEEEFTKLRRNFDHPVPEGETLKDVYLRVVPYYEQVIRPELMAGENVIVVSHGNTLRALVKYLEHIPDDRISEVEIATGEVLCYQIDKEGNVGMRETRGT